MKSAISGLVFGIGLVLVVSGVAAAGANVTVTRQENKPAAVEIRAGEEVTWVNTTGGVAHIAFAGNDGVQFYLGGKEGNRVKFEKPGTYTYFVHVSGTKVHAHRGTVAVK